MNVWAWKTSDVPLDIEMVVVGRISCVAILTFLLVHVPSAFSAAVLAEVFMENK